MSFVSRAYAARHGLSHESLENVVADCLKAMGQYPDLKTEASAKLGSLTEDICIRDHVSRVTKDFLTQVLGSS